MMGDQQRSARRDFFREALGRVIRPVADYVEKREAPSRVRVVLRPPGAVAESHFEQTCERSGCCVASCPAGAIIAIDGPAAGGAGTPMIDPNVGACVICDGLVCTTVCPSGALRRLTDASAIRMGVAGVYEPLCLRSSGEDCRLCVDRCPVGDEAIRLVGDGPPSVVPDGCVGCGVCQLACPTDPKAVFVRPMSAGRLIRT